MRHAHRVRTLRPGVLAPSALVAFYLCVASPALADCDVYIDSFAPVGSEVPVDSDVWLVVDRVVRSCGGYSKVTVEGLDTDFFFEPWMPASTSFPNNSIHVPLPDLPPNSTFQVTVTGHNGSARAEWTFQTSDRVSEEPLEPPPVRIDRVTTLWDRSDIQYSVRFDVPEEPQESSVKLYEALIPGTDGATWAMYSVDDGDGFETTLYSLPTQDPERPFCIDVRGRNLAGAAGPVATLCDRLILPPRRRCETLGAEHALAFGMVLVPLVLTRRRGAV